LNVTTLAAEIVNTTPSFSALPAAAVPTMSSSEMAQFNTRLAVERTTMAADRSGSSRGVPQRSATGGLIPCHTGLSCLTSFST
jgi:hypothetical protein